MLIFLKLQRSIMKNIFIALPNPSIEIIKDIEAMLYTFIWKSSVNRVN